MNGGFEGRDPGPEFDSSWYLETYRDVKKARINPLVNFLNYGKAEGRSQYSEKAIRNEDLEANLAMIRSTSLFDEVWYLTKYPDIAKAKIDPARHYLLNGGFEGRDPGPDFDSSWYMDTFVDVKANFLHLQKSFLISDRLPQPPGP